ncbi:DUF4279 domain-containing protein [Marinomonas mediterranea]|jgi:hypothetical protein|uniref:DUF4279 domain-containing protein n=1 Tax=Marinomonas mediterranea (strain ATCC 700492 / JCM 21426 / NBRC 103028 / MMB-1) TaxID=717774 RepID=F2JZ57_MARM1|nr:DUF4279 domain-containing protein [Marinomonas mediterranea]ADZ92035.1 hypothetical protein Marme_2812 [Marinomonas mediterranea MMB-1]WCN10002.1 DUF4279 domain-containing protein [Marinomonas mediterranea]WCN14049.1 DUF4279 domain-containing protein [Marinomonas mediterranea]WCN18108.1 DUF4279 domain-containing protein [Marinomonas mediterranea MMB-1]
MEEELYFDNSATLRIFSETKIDFEEIEKTLGITPTSKHKKGERRGAKTPPYKHDMWSLESGLKEEESLEKHLLALWGILKPHKEYLLTLKETAKIDVFCGYRSNNHIAGVDLSHQALELFSELKIDFSLSIITT